MHRGLQSWSFAEADELVAGRILTVSHGTASPELRAMLFDAELSATAVVPLGSNGETEGTIVCGLEQTSGFTAEQIDALQFVASHVALLVRNARLETETARRVRRP